MIQDIPQFEHQIGIMGGTFDPIHCGHLYMAQECLNRFNLERVIFLPAGNPPHKQKYRVTNKYTRYEMTCLAVEGEPKFEVSDIEIKRDGFTYTYDSLMQLKEMYPNSRFFYIIGADTLNELYSWYKIEEVAKMTRFLVVGRSNIPAEVLHNAAQRVREDFGGHLVDAGFTGPEVSSTLIRKCAREKRPLKDLVPPKVEEYIIEHAVYDVE